MVVDSGNQEVAEGAGKSIITLAESLKEILQNVVYVF